MKSGIEHSKEVSQSEIAVVAYHMWEMAGHPGSRDLQFWLAAEEQLRAAAKTVTTAQKPANPSLGPSQTDGLIKVSAKGARL